MIVNSPWFWIGTVVLGAVLGAVLSKIPTEQYKRFFLFIPTWSRKRKKTKRDQSVKEWKAGERDRENKLFFLVTEDDDGTPINLSRFYRELSFARRTIFFVRTHFEGEDGIPHLFWRSVLACPFCCRKPMAKRKNRFFLEDARHTILDGKRTIMCQKCRRHFFRDDFVNSEASGFDNQGDWDNMKPSVWEVCYCEPPAIPGVVGHSRKDCPFFPD